MFMVGADPEVFVFDKGNNKFVSGHGMVEGTKYNPTPVNFGAVQVDGMALEFNIDPATNEEEFLHNIKAVKAKLQEMVGNSFELKAIPSVYFNKDVWDLTPEEAKELGCDPDFNAWLDGEINVKPENNGTLRTGAGHVHIGWGNNFSVTDPEHNYRCISMIKQLDLSVGLSSLYWDSDSERRKLYGNPGAYRPKKYGVEYRTLSNSWLTSDALTKFVFSATIKAAEDLVKGIHYVDHLPKDSLKFFTNKEKPEVVIQTLTEKFGFPDIRKVI